MLDKKGKNGCERIQRTKRINRGDIQPYYTFVLVKVFMVSSLVRKLMMPALDVSDAFLQVWRKENVVVSVPNWVRVAANDISLMFWQLRLPGQRNAATRWDDRLTQLLEELNFVHMHGTIF